MPEAVMVACLSAESALSDSTSKRPIERIGSIVQVDIDNHYHLYNNGVNHEV
jgi:hypothetical protein